MTAGLHNTAIVNLLRAQRNKAMDDVVQAEAEKVVLTARVAELEQELKRLQEGSEDDARDLSAAAGG